MWFFLFGNKGYRDRLGYIITKCPECRASAAFAVEQERKKFTVFFVPTFQYSKKQFMVCSSCRQVFEVAKELKAEVSGKLMSRKELEAALEQRKRQSLAAAPRCRSCSRVVAEGMVYCPQCGSRLK